MFVSGDLVRLPRDHPLHDYGLPAAEPRPRAASEGIISVPIVDWAAGGIPLGVVYVTTARVDGALFRLPPMGINDPDQRSLDDLYSWLADCALTLLEDCRTLG